MSPSKRVLIASDHAGIDLKTALQKSLPEWTWEDLGPLTPSRVDYPDFAEILCRRLLQEISSTTLNQTPPVFGILICGSGIGMSIAANKFAGIRAALAENTVSARLAREHNDANILCLGSRFIASEYAQEIARIFLTTPLSKEARHQARIDKILGLEIKNGALPL